MGRFWREPLLHFFLVGAGIFALYAYLDRGAAEAPGEIVVDVNRQQALIAQFERTWQRPPTADEFERLVDSWIEQEILYREGLAMGLERDDPVVKRRIAQKMAFISEDLSATEPPDDDVLRDYYEANSETYRREPTYRFVQVYFNPERHDDPLAAAQQALERAVAGDSPTDGALIGGDPTLLPGAFDGNRSQVARTFGDDFADALETLPVGELAGPVTSAYGVHLVALEAREPGGVPELDAVRAAVERDLLAERRATAERRLMDALRARYTVVREPLPVTSDDSGGAAGTSR